MIEETRHPHPHIDPRQPRDLSSPRTNPPVFAWKPGDATAPFGLIVARDEALKDVVLHADGLADPMFLSERALDAGRYWWTWTAGGDQAPVLSFEIGRDAVALEVPSAQVWLDRLTLAHPRIYIQQDQVAELRASITGARAEGWAQLKAIADQLLAEPHEIEEPPFLPDRLKDYDAFFRTWAPILWSSRRFVKGAEILALAWLASGDRRYARAACQRMTSISRWDPEGSSHLSHNDEAHMSVIWDGSKVVDWVWDEFTDEELALVIEQFRRRGEITYDHMHNRGTYGVTRFDSHAGREIVFLALLAMVFHEHIPQAREWLEWLRPVLCGVWPVWAGDDGAWAEGPSYGAAYVTIMTMFATALKRGCGVDLYRRPFWRGHAQWRQWIFPPWAEWMGFGDHSERWRGTWLGNASLVGRIARESGARELSDYVAQFEEIAAKLDEPQDRQMPRFSAQDFLAEPLGAPAPPPEQKQVLRVFPDAGWAAFRTSLREPCDDISLLFRSSPFGAVSHSHANNNDFVLHVAGQCLLMPSGYYAGYGSAHHAHWVWHSKSHNCVTLSGAGQIMRSHNSTGATENAFEDERIAYLRGTADASYADRALRCRRHVVYLKPHGCFLMVDEFVARPEVVSALEWNAHSWNEFDVDEEARFFRLMLGGSLVQAHFMHHHNAFFSLSEGFDPPPSAAKPSAQWYQQYHLRFTPVGIVPRCTLGVVLACGHAGRLPAEVATERVDGTAVARIGDDLLAVNVSGEIAVGAIRSSALAAIVIEGVRYEVSDEGVGVVDGGR